MNDPIESLLRRADETWGGPEIPEDLADRVRVLAERRARRGPIAAAACLAAAAIATSGVRWLAREADAARIRAEIAEFEREASSLASLVRRIEAVEGRRRAAEELRALAEARVPLAEIEADAEEDAAMLVAHGDHIVRMGGRPEEAASTYRRVLRWFGGTQGAEEARKRLEEGETP